MCATHTGVSRFLEHRACLGPWSHVPSCLQFSCAEGWILWVVPILAHSLPKASFLLSLTLSLFNLLCNAYHHLCLSYLFNSLVIASPYQSSGSRRAGPVGLFSAGLLVRDRAWCHSACSINTADPHQSQTLYLQLTYSDVLVTPNPHSRPMHGHSGVCRVGKDWSHMTGLFPTEAEQRATLPCCSSGHGEMTREWRWGMPAMQRKKPHPWGQLALGSGAAPDKHQHSEPQLPLCKIKKAEWTRTGGLGDLR